MQSCGFCVNIGFVGGQRHTLTHAAKRVVLSFYVICETESTYLRQKRSFLSPPSAKHVAGAVAGCLFGVSPIASFDSIRSHTPQMACLCFLAAVQGIWESTGWRLTPSAPTGDMGDSWTVREVRFHERADCLGDPIPYARIIPAEASEIVDGRIDSSWQGCNPCKPHQNYVGYRTATPTVAGCLRIYQCYRTGCVPSLLLQAEVNGQWLDVMTFKTRPPDHWTDVMLDMRPPLLPPPPSPLPSAPPSSPPGGEGSQGLSGGAIAGISAGGSIGLALVLAVCGISVYLCRKMNREIKQANEFRAAAKPTPGTQDNGVELRPADS